MECLECSGKHKTDWQLKRGNVNILKLATPAVRMLKTVHEKSPDEITGKLVN